MKDRSPEWSKIKVIMDLQNENKYDYIFWIDADAIFNIHDIDFMEFVRQNPNSDILICDDNPNSGKDNTINTGTILIKCTGWTKAFFKKIWDHTGEFLYNNFHEQTVMLDLFNANVMNARKHVKVLPTNTFNSAWHLINEGKLDMFVLHIMKSSTDVRRSIMMKWIEKNT
jgi:hypothetical protein